MKYRGSFHLLAFAAFVLIIGMACQALSGGSEAPPNTPVPPPTQSSNDNQNQQPDPPTEAPPTATQESADDGWVTFVDQNNYYQIKVPADWTYEQSVDTENHYYYIDTFTSPDGGAVVENIAYDDGKPFTGGQNGKFALYLLNTFYSKTGSGGDIRVSDDSIQQDGSERLTWSSRKGAYSGISFFEVRGSDRTLFLMFTVDWGDAVKDQYYDLLGEVIASYSSAP